MTGLEVIAGDRFASSIIGKVIDAAQSYLCNNYDHLQSGTEKMVTSLVDSLLQIQAVIEIACKRPITNPRLITWLNNLKNAAYEAEDVLDDLEAKRFHESLKAKNKVTKFASSSGKFVKALFFGDELMGLKSSVDKLSEISKEAKNFIKLLKIENSTSIKAESTDPPRRETSSTLHPNAKIFGRDKEINIILNMILNCQCFSERNADLKPDTQPCLLNDKEPAELSDKEIHKSFMDRTKYGEGNSSDGKDQEINNVKSIVTEQILDKTRYGKANPSGVRDLEIGNIKSSVGEQISMCMRSWKLHVLPICGLGGVGKTTIAKMVYNNKKVKECFDLRAWVYVSDNFDVKRIMREIVLSLPGGSGIDTMMNLDLIERELIKSIENKRFLIVLDDVYDGIETTWSDLFSVLGIGALGSFVLVTTQSEHVAKTIGNTRNIVKLDVLKPEWFELLFHYYAFEEHLFFLEEEELSTLKIIANQIAAKLHGLPLAGVVIGTMLSTRLERAYWKDILKSDWWNDDRARKGILPSLGIGYMHLDSDLKQCFEFCSIFPKHYVFNKNRLVQMWMAHGFIQPNEQEKNQLDNGEIRLEDVGSKWFDKLVDRSFFQATISYGKYVMHDLIRDLAIAVSSNEFCYVECLGNSLPSFPRHLAINCDGSNVEAIIQKNTGLRSVILFGNWKSCVDKLISHIFTKSKGLRLLDFSYIRNKKNSFIYGIHKLSHLRFVDLSFSGIKLIPDEFCVLWHLQVLDVQGCDLRNLPEGLNKLKNLRHLYASAAIISQIPSIGKLTKLQELEEFHVGKSQGYKITELRYINEIRESLILRNLQNISSKEDAATSQLDKKKFLKSLQYEFDYNSDESTTMVELEVLEALKPSPSVEMLTIKGCRGKYFPSWISSSTPNGFSTLRRVQVRSCRLINLPAFGELPYLEVLHFEDLSWIETAGDEFYGCSKVVFPSLKELTFSDMSHWRAWLDAPHGVKSFPNLKMIHLKHCCELKEMPTNSFTSSMVELKLLWCPNIHNIVAMLQGMPSLTYLNISNCCNVLSICCTALRFLEVMCLSDVQQLCFVGGLKSLGNLTKLVVSGIGDILESFQVGQNQEECVQFLTNLHLSYSFGSALKISTFGRLPSLRTLYISYSPVIEYTGDEENWFQHLTSLVELTFSYCRNLRHLPSTLGMLSSLKKLTVVSCPSISSIREAGLPQNLGELYIIGCSNELERRCQQHQGDSWPNIYHIPHVHIDPSMKDVHKIRISKHP